MTTRKTSRPIALYNCVCEVFGVLGVEGQAKALEVSVARLVSDQYIIGMPVAGSDGLELEPPAVLHAHLSHLLRRAAAAPTFEACKRTFSYV